MMPFYTEHLYLYEVDGPSADSIGIAGFTMVPEGGMPVGYDNEAVKISTWISAESEGLTICLDSAKILGTITWEWASTQGMTYFRPGWDGPHCFTITSCCHGMVGDANGLGDDVPTIGDISVIVDAKFIASTCVGKIACIEEADVNLSADGIAACDDITIGDISILVDYLFITGPDLYGPLPDCP
jgi:hypothetical protein